jgi:hypothetical protein
MENSDRRRFPRIKIFDPISFLSIDSKGKVSEQNLAVVRNLSQTGLQIETFSEINSKYISLICLDINKKEVEATGEVVYCKKSESGEFYIGINLQGTSQQNLQFVTALVRSYHYQKEKSRLVISSGLAN